MKSEIYRLLDVSEVDHSGNREFIGDYIDDRDRARSIAAALNAEEGR